MKKVFLLTFLLSFTFTVKAQSFLSLDSCRALALANNKDLLISNEKISAAHYQRKAAFTNYYNNFGIPLLVPYTKDFERITQF